MPKKLTTYNRPSLISQIQSGHGTERQIVETYMALRQRGACNKTLKRMRKAILNRFPDAQLLLVKLEREIA